MTRRKEEKEEKKHLATISGVSRNKSFPCRHVTIVGEYVGRGEIPREGVGEGVVVF